MVARDLISDTVPSLKTSDPVRLVLEWMNEFKVNQLPVVNNEELLGLVSEDDLLDLDDEDMAIGAVRLSLPQETFVYEDSHSFEVIRMASLLRLDVLPVLQSKDNHYLGIITKKDIVEHAGYLLNANEPGGIIVLEVSQNSYHLSEIARICESNDAKILNLTVANSRIDPSKLHISIKLNIRELSRVLATFERFEYTVTHFVMDARQNEYYQEQYESLIRYLNL